MDWEGLKKTAYGPLQLKPHQFWALTLGEFNDLMEGWKWRDEHEFELLAWQTAHLLNVHTKRRITPQDLLKKKATVNRGATTPEQTRKTLEELEAEVT